MYPLFAHNRAYLGICIPASARVKIVRRSDRLPVAFFNPVTSNATQITGGSWLLKTELATPKLLSALYDQVLQVSQERLVWFSEIDCS